MENDFFPNELTWDGIIAIIAILLGTLGFFLPMVWRWWRANHPIQAKYSLDKYDFQPDRLQRRRLKNAWDLKVGSNELLVRVSPHTELVLRRIRVKLVEPQWFTGWRLRRWVPVGISTAEINDLVDMFHTTSSSPLYYFDSMVDVDGSFEGVFFDDHDNSKGIVVPAGGYLWLGVFINGQKKWKGRLEVEVSASGKRTFERKSIRIPKKPNPYMADYRISETVASRPETATDYPDR